ncbi:MAG TPA: PHB depolymerase family esterase [Myxococcota bacterium]|nr:PHB depolymerase family esterase [Myxococcota bacterium]
MRLLRALGFALVLLVVVAAALWVALGRFVPAPEPPLSAKIAEGTLDFGGRTRHYLVYVPARVGPQPALVLAFHGSMGDGAQARAGYGYAFDRLADEHGFVVVYPDGVERHWNDCRKRAPYAAHALGIDDVGFVRALVDRFAQERGIDRTRVYATGVSNGGQMAIRLALEAPELVRAVAPVIASVPATENMDCKPKEVPVSILFMNGSADPFNPYGGGDVVLYGVWGNRGKVLSTVDSAIYFAALAGYAGEPQRDTLPDRDPTDGSTVERARWTEPGKKTVVLYTIRGGGHTIPHPVARIPRLLGRTNADITAADEIWAFFAAAP